MKETVVKVLGISVGSYYRWKKERFIIPLLEKYFSREDLEEFVETGRIEKFERGARENSDMEEFFLKNALMKIELYGTPREARPLDENKRKVEDQSTEKEALLPVKTLLHLLESNRCGEFSLAARCGKLKK